MRGISNCLILPTRRWKFAQLYYISVAFFANQAMGFLCLNIDHKMTKMILKSQSQSGRKLLRIWQRASACRSCSNVQQRSSSCSNVQQRTSACSIM